MIYFDSDYMSGAHPKVMDLRNVFKDNGFKSAMD